MSALKRIFVALMLGAFLVSVSACNTIKGAGKDTERAGEKIQDATGK